MSSILRRIKWGMVHWWRRYLERPLVTPNHVAVMALYGVGAVGTGLIYLLGIQEATALTEETSEQFVSVWMTLSLIGGLLAVWGAALATKRRHDPRDGLKIELSGTILIALTQGIYLFALGHNLGWGSPAQTQLYAFMFMVAGGVRALMLPFEIIKARVLFMQANKIPREGVKAKAEE